MPGHACQSTDGPFTCLTRTYEESGTNLQQSATLTQSREVVKSQCHAGTSCH